MKYRSDFYFNYIRLLNNVLSYLVFQMTVFSFCILSDHHEINILMSESKIQFQQNLVKSISDPVLNLLNHVTCYMYILTSPVDNKYKQNICMYI